MAVPGQRPGPAGGPGRPGRGGTDRGHDDEPSRCPPGDLPAADVRFYNEHGYLRLKGVFSPDEVAELSEDLDAVIENFATRGKGWSGPWRQQLMDATEEPQSVLVALHEIEMYAASWMRAIVKPRLSQALADILGPAVEFHHATLHAKGPDFGAPFPMHQDHPFYPHQDGRYIDAILHVDGADDDGGCLKFLDRSHTLGPLQHNMTGSPHLDQTVYRLDEAVACPGRSGGRRLLQHPHHPRLVARTASRAGAG